MNQANDQQPKTNDVSGILLIDKPLGFSSFKICSIIRRKLGVKRVGHGGTLDPEATGLLIILIGKATRLFDGLMRDKKCYEGTICLGEARDTQDAAGKITDQVTDEEVSRRVTPEKLEEVRKTFLGPQIQTAPMYSALKHKGKPLYKYARKNIEVEPKKRNIEIYSLEIELSTNKEVRFKAEVSKGTYLRTIAHDFGEKMGTFGYLGSLRRTSSGEFNVKNALTLDEIDNMEREDIVKKMIPIEQNNYVNTNFETRNSKQIRNSK